MSYFHFIKCFNHFIDMNKTLAGCVENDQKYEIKIIYDINSGVHQFCIKSIRYFKKFESYNDGFKEGLTWCHKRSENRNRFRRIRYLFTRLVVVCLSEFAVRVHIKREFSLIS